MSRRDLVLVHGLFFATDPANSDHRATAGKRRADAFIEHADALGVLSYEWVDGRGRGLANRLLRMARGTARAVDAVEIIHLDEQSLRTSLQNEAGRDLWRQVGGCEPCGFDTSRSFVLAGKPRRLIEGPHEGMRVLWFGNGLSRLSQDEFVAYYTGHHGPLVAGHARIIGLKRYIQIPAERGGPCDSLRELGLGRGVAPAVFAELVMGAPPLSPAMVLSRRKVNREIGEDEKRHIDFHHSMLLLAGKRGPGAITAT